MLSWLSEKKKGCLKLFQDGEAELAQLAFQGFFLAIAVPVAQGVELGGVVHVGEVGQLVADDVTDKRFGQEHEVAGELNDLFDGAMPQLPHATAHLEACRLESQLVSYALGKRQQDGMGLNVHGTPDDAGKGTLDIVIVKIGTLMDLQVQGIAFPMVEDIAQHTAL